ncbi:MULTISPECIES: DUF4232 domain-containing protein [unclassified Streptomyces]|uniref:DUF4232 domain-containing protein n=1 Tax=unclassified Streptomyces TaxID=2593676 RepID=UPI0004BD1447|nr:MULTISPECIES: DUF4232 domain-containing protein [unclassified Streptomyces]
MRVHQLTLAAVAVAASFALTACQNGDDGAGPSTPSGSSTASAPSTASPSAGGSDQGGTKPSPGTGSDGKGTAAGAGSDASGKVGKCRTDELAITAAERTIGGDTDGTVAVTLKNRGARDCTISGYAGVDLKTASGSLSAQRTGQQADTAVLKKGESTYFGISYPLNTSGGSGVRVTGLVVTPPDETRSVTLAWPGTGTLPVTEGGGSPVKVGPVGSAGQGG